MNLPRVSRTHKAVARIYIIFIGDTFAYIKKNQDGSGALYGGKADNVKPYICVYNIQEQCDAAE